MVRIACSIVAISLTLAATVGPSAAGAGCASGVSCPNGDCCISSAAVCNVEFGDCCESGKLCGGGTVCCANAGDTCCDVGGSSRCCAAGTSCTADGLCCASGVSCPEGGCCVSSAAVCNTEFDDCCESGKLCGGGTVCCANAGDTCCDVGGSSRCCAAGTSCTADGQCVQNTPTATLSATPTHTPIPNGGSCVDPLDCASGNCVDDVCCNSPCTDPLQKCNLPGQVGTCASAAAEAPALTPWGIIAGLALLASTAAWAIRRRRT